MCAKDHTLRLFDQLVAELRNPSHALYLSYSRRPVRGEKADMTRVRGQQLEGKFVFEVSVSLHSPEVGDTGEDCYDSITINFIYAVDQMQPQADKHIPSGVLELMKLIPTLTREGATAKMPLHA